MQREKLDTLMNEIRHGGASGVSRVRMASGLQSRTVDNDGSDRLREQSRQAEVDRMKRKYEEDIKKLKDQLNGRGDQLTKL